MLRDLLNNVNPKPAISPAAAITDNTAAVSSIIDTAGYNSLTWLIQTGSLADADATFAATMDESDASDLSGSNAVADEDIIGGLALASFTFAADNSILKVGYKGTKRYVRLTVTPTANGGNAFLSAIALLGHPMNAPTPNPPA